MTAPRGIAFFDFDGTLVHGDSLYPFLCLLAGRTRVWAAFAGAFLAVPFVRAADPRGWVKARVLRQLLAGRRIDDLDDVLERLAAWPRWKAEPLAALQSHFTRGHRIVIASGGLRVYLPHLLRGIPYHDLICTDLVVDGGIMTGAMLDGNCVRARKAALVAAYLQEHGPFDESWGYGNAPHDLPMMAHVDHAVVI